MSQICNGNATIMSSHSSGSSCNKDLEANCIDNEETLPFTAPKRILIVTKVSRYEVEQRQNSNLTEDQLHQHLQERGISVKSLLTKHDTHKESLELIVNEFRKRDIETKLVRSWEYTDELVKWADWIFSAGGNGTFLLAAARIKTNNKPLIGINTDPANSEGSLCLLHKQPVSRFPKALNKLLSGEFQWLYRQRIRITMTGECAIEKPLELKPLKLAYPECRWVAKRKNSITEHTHSSCGSCFVQSPTVCESEKDKPMRRGLGALALNEVYIGDSVSARTSYYEISIDGDAPIRQKSSGLTVCTGTGSSSWHFASHHITANTLSRVLEIIESEAGTKIPEPSEQKLNNICQKFNRSIVFSPSDLRMAYSVKEQIVNETFPFWPSLGYAQMVNVKSLGSQNVVIVDGGLSYPFHHGNEVVLRVLPADVLKTVIFN